MINDLSAKQKRSYIMSRVKQKDTKIEVLLRSKLHRLGYRFRINNRNLPGSPDIVLNKYTTAIFVHGCFWHGHGGCKKSRMPKTHLEYWLPKIDNNKKRDSIKTKELLQMGWRVAVVWQCSLDNISMIEPTISSLTEWLNKNTLIQGYSEF